MKNFNRIEMKYFRNNFNFMLGLGWLTISILGICMVLFFTMTPLSLGAFIVLPILLVFLSSLNSYLHVSVYLGKRAYIVIEQETIYKDNGLMRPKSIIDIKSTNNILITGSSLRISELNGREMRINLDCLKLDDICILKQKLGLQ